MFFFIVIFKSHSYILCISYISLTIHKIEGAMETACRKYPAISLKT